MAKKELEEQIGSKLGEETLDLERREREEKGTEMVRNGDEDVSFGMRLENYIRRQKLGSTGLYCFPVCNIEAKQRYVKRVRDDEDNDNPVTDVTYKNDDGGAAIATHILPFYILKM